MVDLRTAPPPQPPPRPPSPYRRSRGRFIGLLVLAAVGVAAIVFLVVNAGDEAPPSEFVTRPTPTTAPPTTVDPEAATKAEIEAAYRQSFEVFVAVASDPNGQADDPRLKEYKVGNALLAAQVSIQRLRNAGHVFHGHIEVNPTVVELGPDSAVVQDCGVDLLSVVDHQTGEVVIPPGPPEGNLATATYRLVDGVWMQNGFTDEKRPCVPPGS
ncbi:MAG TPA: hypothetical protein VGV93_03465 [Acidimicrobiales bacterium]|nr:hypothetical protein [Acidimicrobiales bacterium]